MQTREHDETSSALLAGDDADAAPDGGDSESELQRYDEEEIATKPWPPASN